MRKYLDIVRLNETTEADDLVMQAIQMFGVTRNYREAGFIVYYRHMALMLDFSGKHEHGDYEKRDTEYRRGVYPMHILKPNGQDDLRDQRYTDHRQIAHLEMIGGQGTDALYEFMRRTGAIRVIPGSGITVATVPPMSMLVMAMRGHRENYGSEPLVVDVVDVADREHSQSFSIRHGWQTIQKYIAGTIKGK